MSTSLHELASESPPPPLSTLALPRILGDIGDPAAGPTLIVIGGLHGNEPAGVHSLQRLFQRFAEDGCTPEGRFVGLAGNRAALEIGQRFIDDDLNRVWFSERIDELRRCGGVRSAEELEILELDAIFQQLLDEARGKPFVLDIHTTSGPGPAFSVLHDTLTNRRFARAMPIPITLGLEEELNGTLTDYFTEQGAVALSVEAGQHDDPRSIDRAVAALWIALDVAGMLPERYLGALEDARALLELEGRGLPEAVEVRYHHAITADCHFRMMPGFRSFQPITFGQPVASERGQTVASPMTGMLLMPLYQALGSDGFFLTRPVHSLWLDLSTVLRRARIERWLKFLPGVQVAAGAEGTYLVNRRIARWGPRQLFHILGFRRRDHSSTHLVMQKRPEPVD